MRILFSTLLVGLLGLTAPAQAGDGAVVVELFTSQGCSACPPADALFTELTGRDDVIALALHVDYWDYLGWRDNFGDPAYTARQRAYARAAHSRTVYTPQIIVQGKDHIVGNKPEELESRITLHKSAPGLVILNVTRNANTVEINAKPVGKPVGKTVISLVRYTPQASVNIRRGENAGKRIVYSNIVNSWTQIGKWNGQRTLKTRAIVLGDDPVVVIVQADGQGPILAAHELP